uniref:Uncharacterized protein n=1 Tax=Aegilops tauschii subsp. strangulata TaxID=200361 RepID=A0A453MR49_AEGTS
FSLSKKKGKKEETTQILWLSHSPPAVVPHSLAAGATAPPRRHAPAPSQPPLPDPLVFPRLSHLPPQPPHLRRRARRLPPNPSFAVEDYLVSTCGLTRPQALKASAKLSHLKSPSKPDAVLAFLAGLGLSAADVAALVVNDPLFLCAKVEKTLAPIVIGLTALGLSHSEIARPRSQRPAVPLRQSGENPGPRRRWAHRPRPVTF